MVKIAETVEKIFREDLEAQAAYSYGVLNVTAYARAIQPQVEQELLKEVSPRTIAVSLSRILAQQRPIRVNSRPKLLNVSVHTDLLDYSYERTKVNLQHLANLSQKFLVQTDHFFTITQSVNELTIITEESFRAEIEQEFTTKPLFTARKLAGVTVKFSAKYLDQPNLIYELTRRLAHKRVNIIEVVSTTTELTYIIAKKDTGVVVEQMTKLL